MTGPKSWRDLVKVHPAADAFPMMLELELATLTEDVGENGIQVPTVFWTPTLLHDFPGPRAKQRQQVEIFLLDGRNRLEALWRHYELGEEVGEREKHFRWLLRAAIDGSSEEAVLVYGDDDPWERVISANLHRRHLDASQRAMVAAKIATARQGERTDLAQISARSQADAAQLLNVSRGRVQNAAAVRRDGIPELVEQVERGEIAVSAAATIAQKPPGEQREIMQRPAPVEARRIARETGNPVSARDGRVHAPPKPASKVAQIRALREQQAAPQAVDPPLPPPAQQRPRIVAEIVSALRVLQGDLGRVDQIPLAKRIALARGVLTVLHVTLDDLKPIGGTP